MYFVRMGPTTKWYNMEGFRYTWEATCERCGAEFKGGSGDLERALFGHEYDVNQDGRICPRKATP